MFKLKYENSIDFSERNQIMIRATFGYVLLIAAGQISIFLFELYIGQLTDVGRALLLSCMVPILFYFAMWGIMIWSNTYLSHKNKPALLAYINLLCINLMLFVLVLVNYHDSSIYAVFIFPIFSAILYVDMKPLVFAFVLCLLFYWAHAVFILRHRPDYLRANQGFLEVTTMSVVLVAAYLLARIMLKSLTSMVNNIMSKDEEIKRDSFTGLFNHSSFYENLDECILENHRTNLVFSLIIWDIDNFKSINDTFGHDMGDKVLSLFTKALNECIAPEDRAFRYGGEEFAVLTAHSAKTALMLSNRVRERFTQYTVTLPLGKVITASAGICEYDRSFGGSREFFSACDRALYEAKNTKDKNTSRIWQDAVSMVH